MPVFDHAAHVQVLDADRVKPACQIGRELMQGIIANVADTGVQPGQFGLRLLPVLRAFDFARQAARQPLQSGQKSLARLWPRDAFSR